MKWYVKPKCTHAFILHLFLMIKGIPNVLILYPLGPLMNFQINTQDSLQFQQISNSTMVCYHQNLIRRTIWLTISLFFIMTNLSYLGEEEYPPSNQSWINQSKFMKLKPRKSRHAKENEFWIRNSVSHETYSIIYIS